MLTSTLAYYYSVNETENFEKNFKGLYVYDHPTPYKNSYYILQLNFSGIDTGANVSIEEMHRQFSEIIYYGVIKCISMYDLNIEITKDNNAAGIIREFLTKFEQQNRKTKIYIMIDEYDHFTNGILKGDA